MQKVFSKILTFMMCAAIVSVGCMVTPTFTASKSDSDSESDLEAVNWVGEESLESPQTRFDVDQFETPQYAKGTWRLRKSTPWCLKKQIGSMKFIRDNVFLSGLMGLGAYALNCSEGSYQQRYNRTLSFTGRTLGSLTLGLGGIALSKLFGKWLYCKGWNKLAALSLITGCSVSFYLGSLSLVDTSFVYRQTC